MENSLRLSQFSVALVSGWCQNPPSVRAVRIFLLLCPALLGTGIAFGEGESSETKTNSFTQPKNLAELLALPPDQLEKVDIAVMNLLCAEGLPGAEDLDVEKCIQTLDSWVQYVKSETDKNLHRFLEHPEKFKNSFERFRMAVMAAVLCQDLRVQYNPPREKELLRNNFFTNRTVYSEAERSFCSDSSDLFLHGILSQKRYGTCASLPYIYVAIGRRLGYPVSIAHAYMHSYVYYDEGGGKHFNVEATENRTFITPSDDEYRHPAWGAPSTPDYYEKRDFLKPLSNKEELAHMLATRAGVFRSAGRHDEEAKTWATAARYFPDTPTWKMVAENMQRCAKMDDYHNWRDGIWRELSNYYIPHGPGYAYFRDKKIKLHLFMNESLDRKAVEQAADEYKKELSEYSRVVMPPPDNGNMALNVAITNSPPESPPLYFFYRPPDGNQVNVPADFMPPFPHGELPMELKARIANSKPQDPDTLLEIVWDYHGQMQAMEREKQKAEVERIASGNPILISEESIPYEFRNGVPMDLGIQLSGLHSAQEIVIAMWQYKQQQALRQQQGMLTDPIGQVSAMLRQAGVSDSVARMSGLPVAGPQGSADPLTAALRQAGIPESIARMSGLPASGSPSAGTGLPGMGNVPGLTPFDTTPPAAGSAVQGFRRGAWAENAKRANEQVMATIEQQMRPQQDTMKPRMALPYQVVPGVRCRQGPDGAEPDALWRRI